MTHGRDEGLDTNAILRGIRRRHKRLIAILFLGILIPGAVLVFWFSRPGYFSTATIAIETSLLDQLGPPDINRRRQSIDTALAYLQSRSVAEGVLEALPRDTMDELLTHPQRIDYFAVLGNVAKYWMGKPQTDLSPQQRALTELRSARMEFVQNRESPGIINVTATASRPQVAMDLVNTYIQVLLGRTKNANQEDARKAAEFLETQIQQTKNSLRQSEESLVRFQQQRGHIQLGSETMRGMAQLSQLDGALAEAQASQEVLAARMQALRQILAGGAQRAANPSGDQARQLQAFRAAQERLARLEERLTALRERYTDAHPLVQVTQDEIATERARVTQMAKALPAAAAQTATPVIDRADAARQLAALQNEAAGQQARVDGLKRQLDRQRGNLRNVNEDEMQLSRLQGAVDSQRSLLTVLGDKLMTARMREQGEGAQIRIIDPASFPFAPADSRKATQLLLAIVALAFGVSFGGAFSLEYWRQPVETETDVQKATELPVLGSVGVIRKTGRGKTGTSLPIPVNSATATAIHLELYRAIRANMEAERLRHPFHTVLVTSPNPSEGKSTTILNLAQVFHEFGRRVLVVEADLRRPALFRAFSVTNKPGIVDVIKGAVPFEQALRRTPPGFSLLPGQVSREDISALLASPAFAELLRRARSQFDLVLVDSAPVLAVPDNLLLAPMLDRVLLVANASQTSKRELSRAATVLAQVDAKILGVVLNQASAVDVHYYRHRYHKYWPNQQAKAA